MRPSGESEIMSMSELLKEAKLTQYNHEVCGMGLLPIVLYTDADVAKACEHVTQSMGCPERLHNLSVSHDRPRAELTMLLAFQEATQQQNCA